MKVEELIKRYLAGERDFRGVDLRGADLSGVDLEWADLSGADLEWTNLEWAILRGTILERANLSGAFLRGADLEWANLRGAHLRGAHLSHNKTILHACLGAYTMYLHQGKEGLMVKAGCRYFSTERARDHWQPGNIHSWTHERSDYGERQLRMLDFLINEWALLKRGDDQ